MPIIAYTIKKENTMQLFMNDSVGFNLTKTANAMRNRFNTFLKPYGLTSEQYIILKAIKENPDITQTQLAEILEKEKTTLSRMLDTLIKNGFILKQTPANDRRSFTLQWTEKTHTVMFELVPAVTELNAKVLSLFEPDEVACFFKFMRRLRSIEKLDAL